MIRTHRKGDIKGTYLNRVKTIYDIPTANILRSETKQKHPFSPLLFNMVLEVLNTATGQEKEIKRIQIGKEEKQLSLSACNMILYRENPTQKSPKTTRAYPWIADCKAAGYKINVNKFVVFLYTNNQPLEREIKKIMYNCIKKSKIPRNNFNQGGKRSKLWKLWDTE